MVGVVFVVGVEGGVNVTPEKDGNWISTPKAPTCGCGEALLWTHTSKVPLCAEAE